MAATAVFFDTSVLLAGLLDLGAPSESAQRIMDAVAAGKLGRPRTAWHCCLEFYAVSTRMPEELRLTPAQAGQLLAAEIRERMEVVGLSQGRWDEFWARAQTERVAGGRITTPTSPRLRASTRPRSWSRTTPATSPRCSPTASRCCPASSSPGAYRVRDRRLRPMTSRTLTLSLRPGRGQTLQSGTREPIRLIERIVRPLPGRGERVGVREVRRSWARPSRRPACAPSPPPPGCCRRG